MKFDVAKSLVESHGRGEDEWRQGVGSSPMNNSIVPRVGAGIQVSMSFPASSLGDVIAARGDSVNNGFGL